MWIPNAGCLAVGQVQEPLPPLHEASEAPPQRTTEEVPCCVQQLRCTKVAPKLLDSFVLKPRIFVCTTLTEVPEPSPKTDDRPLGTPLEAIQVFLLIFRSRKSRDFDTHWNSMSGAPCERSFHSFMIKVPDATPVATPAAIDPQPPAPPPAPRRRLRCTSAPPPQPTATTRPDINFWNVPGFRQAVLWASFARRVLEAASQPAETLVSVLGFMWMTLWDLMDLVDDQFVHWQDNPERIRFNFIKVREELRTGHVINEDYELQVDPEVSKDAFLTGAWWEKFPHSRKLARMMGKRRRALRGWGRLLTSALHAVAIGVRSDIRERRRRLTRFQMTRVEMYTRARVAADLVENLKANPNVDLDLLQIAFSSNFQDGLIRVPKITLDHASNDYFEDRSHVEQVPFGMHIKGICGTQIPLRPSSGSEVERVQVAPGADAGARDDRAREVPANTWNLSPAAQADDSDAPRRGRERHRDRGRDIAGARPAYGQTTMRRSEQIAFRDAEAAVNAAWTSSAQLEGPLRSTMGRSSYNRRTPVDFPGLLAWQKVQQAVNEGFKFYVCDGHKQNCRNCFCRKRDRCECVINGVSRCSYPKKERELFWKFNPDQPENSWFEEKESGYYMLQDLMIRIDRRDIVVHIANGGGDDMQQPFVQTCKWQESIWGRPFCSSYNSPKGCSHCKCQGKHVCEDGCLAAHFCPYLWCLNHRSEREPCYGLFMHKNGYQQGLMPPTW